MDSTDEGMKRPNSGLREYAKAHPWVLLGYILCSIYGVFSGAAATIILAYSWFFGVEGRGVTIPHLPAASLCVLGVACAIISCRLVPEHNGRPLLWRFYPTIYGLCGAAVVLWVSLWCIYGARN